MFNLKLFKAMLNKRGVTMKDVARYLGKTVSTLYRKVKNGGDFTKAEIDLLINFFGREEVLACLFCYE